MNNDWINKPAMASVAIQCQSSIYASKVELKNE